MIASLKKTLPNDLNYQIVIINDASTEGELEISQFTFAKEIQLLSNNINIGFGRSVNRAVKFTVGEFVCILNSDLFFSESWLQPMLAILMNSNLNAGLVGNVQYSYSSGLVDHSGIYLNLNGQLAHNVQLNTQASIKKVFAMTGACLLLRRSDFDLVRGFSENFINGCEDIDLCLKIRSLNKNLYISEKSKIYHHIGLTRGLIQIRDESNSRALYSKWRVQLKSELSKMWLHAFDMNESNDLWVNEYIKSLSPKFISTKQLASQMIAESFLLKQEFRWKRELDGFNPRKSIENKISSSGVNYSKKHGYYVLQSNVIFITISEIQSIRNFYICGKIKKHNRLNFLTIQISVNEIQFQIFHIKFGNELNLGIINPLIFPDIKNIIKIKFFCAEESCVGEDIFNSILISHIVVDDYRMDIF